MKGMLIQTSNVTLSGRSIVNSFNAVLFLHVYQSTHSCIHKLYAFSCSVSLEVLEDGVTPKPPEESENDGLPKLYVHRNAFMKVLGCTLDVDEENMVPLLYDREGNKLDPNA
jgi:hypothetical protein